MNIRMQQLFWWLSRRANNERHGPLNEEIWEARSQDNSWGIDDTDLLQSGIPWVLTRTTPANIKDQYLRKNQTTTQGCWIFKKLQERLGEDTFMRQNFIHAFSGCDTTSPCNHHQLKQMSLLLERRWWWLCVTEYKHKAYLSHKSKEWAVPQTNIHQSNILCPVVWYATYSICS